jgi:hypothetical protein
MSMRVLMTTDCVGGVWRYAVSLAQELSLSGVLTILASMGPSANAKQKAEADAIPGLQLIETGLPLDWMAETEAVIAKSAARSLQPLTASIARSWAFATPALPPGGMRQKEAICRTISFGARHLSRGDTTPATG